MKAATFGDRFPEIVLACGWLTDTLRHPGYDELAGWFEAQASDKSCRAITAAATIDQRAEWLPHLLPSYLTRSGPRDRAQAERCGVPWAWPATSLHGPRRTAWRIAAECEHSDGPAEAAAERTELHARLSAFSALGEPAKPAAIAAALARLLGVLDQTMPEPMASFTVEILRRSHAPLAAVLHLMEHVARTEGGRVRPATFAAAIEAIGERQQAFFTEAVWPARAMLADWVEACELLTAGADVAA